MSLILSFCIFYLSFTPLWISVVFVDIMSIVKCSPTIWTEKISIVLILIVFILSMLFLYFGLKGGNGDNVEQYTLKSAYEEKSITVEYLLSYILPLFAFDFTTWEGVALFAIFFATLGFLCIKHSFFCVNIVLELFNYSFYRCELINDDQVTISKIVISKKKLSGKIKNEICAKAFDNEYFLDVTIW